MTRRPAQGELRAGLIGAGLIGRIHSMMLRRVANRAPGSVRVVAIGDRDHRRAEELASRWPGARAVSHGQEIIDDPEVDAVWICTPTNLHHDLLISAARAGKHIFCEKPVAMNVAEAREMMEAINASRVTCQVGLVLRFSPVYTVMRSMVGEADAGRLVGVVMRDDQDFPIRGVHSSGWRNDPAQTAGGTLIEHSVHDLDLMRWMFGEPLGLLCVVRNLAGAAGVEDYAATTMQLPGGAFAQLSSLWHRMGRRASDRRLEIFCERMFMASDYDATGPILLQRGDGPIETISEAEVTQRFNEIILKERPWLGYLGGSLSLPYAAEDAAFVEAVHGRAAPDPGFGAGVEAQRLAETAYESARTGGAVLSNS